MVLGTLSRVTDHGMTGIPVQVCPTPNPMFCISLPLASLPLFTEKPDALEPSSCRLSRVNCPAHAALSSQQEDPEFLRLALKALTHFSSVIFSL